MDILRRLSDLALNKLGSLLAARIDWDSFGPTDGVGRLLRSFRDAVRVETARRRGIEAEDAAMPDVSIEEMNAGEVAFVALSAAELKAPDADPLLAEALMGVAEILGKLALLRGRAEAN